MLDNPLIKRPKYCHLWNVLLLLAQHKKSDFIFGGERWTLETGQLLTGRKRLAELSGVSESHIERILKYLENEHQITQLKTNKFRIITIINWDKYQNGTTNGTTPEQQGDSKGTTEGQQKDTYKNDNNVKTDKNEKKRKALILFDKFWEVYPRKVAKKKAQERWLQINPDEQLAEQIVAAVRAQKASGLFKEMDFTPHPATWLNAGRWTDQLPKEAEKASRRRAEADVNARKQESERQEAAAKARKNLEFAETIKKFSDGQLAEFWRKSVNSRTEIERMRPDRKALFDKLRLGV